MNRKQITQTVKRLVFITSISFSATMGFAQSNVYDDIIATSPNHTTLAAAINAAGLTSALQNEDASLTVFAPTDAAFAALAQQLGLDVTALLSLPNLSDILLYHVMGSNVPASAVTNGGILAPLYAGNSLKLTLKSNGTAYVNHALISTVDIDAENGLVHVIDAVLLPTTTVVDVALANGFTTLAAAVIQAELLPELTNPFAELTVFAPTNDAFNTLATNLDTDLNGLLALSNLADVLTYHVLGAEALSTSLTNGQLATPLNTANTIKLTVKQNGDVFANQAKVTLADVMAENGVVHVIDQVILPSETVVDVALDNGFTTLAAAVIQAELLPELTNPFAELTVFAPTNDAFNTLATNLDTDLNGLLALPNLADVLTYHVLGAEALSTSLTNGQLATPLNTANTIKLTVKQNGDVFANQAKVTLADVMAENGVVHVIDQVILPSETVVDVALDNGFTTLAAAVIQAELLPALTNPFAELTVFAPTNDAFNTLASNLDTDLNGLLALPNLADVLTYHVLTSEVLSSDLANGTVQTLNGNNIAVNIDNGVMINDATVVTADVTSDNGVVHIIDKVLMPGTLGINSLEKETMNVYPNPASATITVEFPTAKIDRLEIVTIEGKVVYATISPLTTLDISTLDAGQYIIKAQAGNQTVTQTFSKLK